MIGASTRILELDGAIALPGFIEGHGHFLSLGLSRMALALEETSSWAEIVALVAVAATEVAPGQWITGRGWHQEKWASVPADAVEGIPVHATLSAVSPNNPVFLVHASGHSAIANRQAMELAGITGSTPDPEGGTIVRDDAGEPTGYLRETAQRLVEPAAPSEAELRRAVELASAESLANGVTSFQDAGTSVQSTRLLRQLAAEGTIGVRLWVMLRDSNDNLAAALPTIKASREANAYFSVGGIKHSIDGALGSHGAWLLEPYDDLPTTGLNTTALETIRRSAAIALEHDLQLCVHAIGDRANRETLDLFAAATTPADLATRRWRIEHAQHLDPIDIPRFAQLGVIASVQGVHATSDGPWVASRIGTERAAAGAYAWRSLLQSGATLSNGTDVPVEDMDPIANFYASVTRRMSAGATFFPAQRMTREEALRSMTLNAAYAAFEEDIKGSLSIGKLADVVVLSHDILTIAAEEILDTQVLYTIVGGQVKYQAEPIRLQ